MKIFFLFFLLLFSCLEGMFIGNPASPSQPPHGYFISRQMPISLKVGYLDYFIYKKRMKDRNYQPGSSTTFLKINFQAGTVLISLKKKLDLYTYLGKSDLDIFQKTSQIRTDKKWSFAAGGKTVFLKWGKVNFTIDISYFFSKQYPAFIVANELPYLIIRNTMVAHRYAIKYKAWQPSIGVSYLDSFISPYVGAVFDFAKMSPYPTVVWLKDPSDMSERSANTAPWSSRHFWGVFFGCSIFNKKALALTVEGRMFDQYAIGGLLEFKF